MTERLEAFYAKTVAELNYRISPRQPLEYRIARCIQRVYRDERDEDLSLSDARLMGQLLHLSFTIGFETSMEYTTKVRARPAVRITRLRGYTDGGVSIRHFIRTIPHHPMRLRTRGRPLLGR